jgi:phosphatidylinositol glycan class A protein
MSSRRTRRGSAPHDPAPHDAAPAKADVSVGSPERGGNNAFRVLLTHRGVSLEERRVDDETTEYTVRRRRSDAIARSAFPAWCALAACFAVAHGLAAVADGTSSGGTAARPKNSGSGSFSPPLAFAAAASLAACLAVRALAGAVVSESAQLMRHVGVRLSHETVLRFGGPRQRGVRFIDVDRLRSAAVLEAVRAKDVRSYLCFRVFPASARPEETAEASAGNHRIPRETTEDGSRRPHAHDEDVFKGEGGDVLKGEGDGARRREGRRVVLVFSKIRPGLPVARAAYRRAHAAMFAAREETVTSRESETALRSEAEAFAESLRCLPGPARGLGWWRGADGTGREGEPREARTTSGRESILMVSDFFLPNLGGVELHMYSLAQRLLKRGHRVTVLTHAYGDRCGVRYMTNGLKVYYAFRVPVYNGSTAPDVFGNFKLTRAILLREKITVVHAHQAFSVMGHEAVFHARTMGYKCVFTDHSLFGFSDTSAIHMNKLLVLTLSDCNHVVCVSHTAKENTVLRSGAPPRRVSVVPNAVDAARFTPDSSKRSENGRVVVAVTARLAYRKGVHLLAGVIPAACAAFPEVDFLVAGDGPMRPHLERMTREHGLTARVTLLGNVPHERVVDVLRRAHVFLNCSLTESFCIAILEAACCGCLVVATKVGGVPEVLPPDLLFLAEPEPEALVAALSEAIAALPGPVRRKKSERRRSELAANGARRFESESALSPAAIHARVREMYSWDDVAARLETVYARAHATRDTMNGRMARLRTCGVFAGWIFCAVAAVDYLYWRWLELADPAAERDAAPEYVPDGEAVTAVTRKEEIPASGNPRLDRCAWSRE